MKVVSLALHCEHGQPTPTGGEHAIKIFTPSLDLLNSNHMKTTHSNKSHVGTIRFIIFASLGGVALSAGIYLAFLALSKIFFA